ncbi:MAG: alpha/beta hydrolase [Actinomycetota bacterium]|nr:alpha/beta hydrolase [Actinomycetota bacterium]
MSSIDDLGFVHRFDRTEGADVTLLVLHGTGGNEDDLISLARSLAPNAHLLSPRGKVLEDGAPRFFRRLAMGVFDVEDLIERTHELAEFVQKATESYGIDSTPVFALGYSNGANIAASLLLLRPELLAGAVMLKAMKPLDPEYEPDLSDIPVLIAGGRTDRMIAPAATDELVDLLNVCGADITVHWEPGGHEITPNDVAAASAWFADKRPSAPGGG